VILSAGTFWKQAGVLSRPAGFFMVKLIAFLWLTISTMTRGSMPPSIIGFYGNQLMWNNQQEGLFSQVEMTSNLSGGVWNPVTYDVARTGNLATLIPTPGAPTAFYRIGVVTNIADPALLVHLTFDNDFTHSGVILDTSGHGNNALRFGRPGYPTNWPTQINGQIGKAGEFHYYFDGWDSSGRSGDYAAITNVGPMLMMTQATFSAWVYYYTAISNFIGNDHNATILDAGYATKGTWHWGRYYSSSYGNTKFLIQTNSSGGTWFLPAPYGPYDNGWPENYVHGVTNNGNSGGWHYYAITVNCSNNNAIVSGYFQGTNFITATCTGVSYLTVQTPTSGAATNKFPWIGIACWTHNGSAPMEAGDDYPNNGWLNGALDDIRIYNRVLSPQEIYFIFTNGLAGKSP